MYFFFLSGIQRSGFATGLIVQNARTGEGTSLAPSKEMEAVLAHVFVGKKMLELYFVACVLGGRFVCRIFWVLILIELVM
jgi:hypothetical protein